MVRLHRDEFFKQLVEESQQTKQITSEKYLSPIQPEKIIKKKPLPEKKKKETPLKSSCRGCLDLRISAKC
jgi:hypothetical protein